MNFEKARFNMVEQQVRTWEVLDQRVLDLLGHIPRDEYVPDAMRRLAYADTNIPLGEEDAVMMAPVVEARMLQALGVQPEDSVLEIGTGSGFVTACLAHLGRHVHSFERLPELSRQAGERLDAHGVKNVTLQVGDGLREAPAGPFDVIAVTGSMPVMDECFHEKLAEGGRLFMIVGEAPAMEALLVTRVRADEWSRDSLFETVIPPLAGARAPQRFVL